MVANVQLPVLPAAQIPFIQEAEQAVLGAIITSEKIYTSLKAFLFERDFFLLRHRYIWKAFEALSVRRDAIDYLTVTSELKKMGKLDEIGGVSYLTELLNSAPSLHNADTYGRMVQRCSLRRQMLEASAKINALALDENETTDHVRAEMMKLVTTVSDIDLNGTERGLGELLNETCDFVEYRMEHPEAMIGVPSGYTMLDRMLLGFQKTDFIVLAARPGMGKTSLMLSTALNMAKAGKHVGFASIEMGDIQLVKKLIALESRLPLQTVRDGNLTMEQHKIFTAAAGRLANLKDNIRIYDHKITPDGLRAKAMGWKSDNGLDVLFVDYLQIMDSAGAFKPNERTREVGYFARSLKAMAKELRIPIVAGAQLNRETDSRSGNKPQLSDLRESGEIEQEADVVMFIYRDEYYNEASEFPNQADIIIAKHRNGPLGTVPLYFDKSLTLFMNAAERSVDLSHV